MTETKPTYSFTVAPPESMSLAELRLLKSEYIERGNDAFNQLSLIVAVFGSPVEIRKRGYWVWQRGRVTALFSIEQGRYLTDRERFQETQVLSIFLDSNGLKGLDNPNRVQVCYLKQGDAVDNEPVFVPGAWLTAMLSEYEAARQVYDQQQADVTENERLALIKQLMIGQDI